MNQKEKSALSKQRILDAAMEEFSQKGYDGASLNTVWADKGISKGIIYHHFRDKDELYLLCVKKCFDAMVDYLQTAVSNSAGTVQSRLRAYFDLRLRFFAENPRSLGIFMDASFNPPKKLLPQIALLRQPFDELNISILTDLLKSQALRPGLSVNAVVEDFRMYMDYFNMHFKIACQDAHSQKDILRAHEERCHRQLDILLYGVLDEKN